MFSFQKPAPLPLDSISSSSRNIAEWSVLIEGMISTSDTKSCNLSDISRARAAFRVGGVGGVEGLERQTNKMSYLGGPGVCSPGKF